MAIKLITHHILVKLDEVETKTASGIILQINEKAERKAVEYGTVVQLGPTAFLDLGRSPDCLKEGDRISLNRYAGKSIVDKDGSEFTLLNDEDVLCIIE